MAAAEVLPVKVTEFEYPWYKLQVLESYDGVVIAYIGTVASGV